MNRWEWTRRIPDRVWLGAGGIILAFGFVSAPHLLAWWLVVGR